MKKTLGVVLPGLMATFLFICSQGVIADSTSSGDDAGILFGWPPGLFYAAGSSTDLAIDGAGYFILRNSLDFENLYYTRFGAFAFDDEGHFVSSQGHIVQGWALAYNPETGEPENTGSIADIHIDSLLSSSDSSSTEGYAFYESTISVNEAGVISAMDTDGHTIPLFRVAVAKFLDPHRLSNPGSNLFRETTASGDAITGNPGSFGLGSLEAYTLEEPTSSPSYETDISIDGNGLFHVRSHGSADQFYFAFKEAFRFDKNGYLVTSNDFIAQGWALEQSDDAGQFERTGGMIDIWLDTFSTPPRETDRITVIANLDSNGGNHSAGIHALSLAWNGDRSLEKNIADSAYVISASETVVDASGLDHTITLYFDMSETAAEYEFIVTCNPAEDNRFSGDPAVNAGHGLLGRGLLLFTPDGVLSGMTLERLVVSDPSAGGAWETLAPPSDEVVPHFEFAADFIGGTETRQLIALDPGIRYNGTGWVADSLSTALSPDPSSVEYSASNGYIPQELSRCIVNRTGIVTGYYSEGLVLPLFRIALSSFQNEAALEKVSDTLYRETTGSGASATDAPGEDGFGTLSFEEREPEDDTSDDKDFVVSCFISSVMR